MSLFVPLDVDYASDDKLIEAGPMAELLYVRGLAFCKRTMSDGHIRRSQLTAVGLGIPSASKHAQRLVDVGAWTVTSYGWRVSSWLKRNKSAAQIRLESDTKKKNSILANHRRWHVGEGKEPSISCPHCYPTPDPRSDPNWETPSDSTETEVEVEPEVEGSQSQSSVAQGSHLALVKTDDDDFSRTVTLVIDAKEREYRPDKPKPWRITVKRNTIAEDGELIRRMLADGDTPDVVAAFVLGFGSDAGSPTAPTPARPWCTPMCETCGGDAWIDTGNGLAPCPDRHPLERTAP